MKLMTTTLLALLATMSLLATACGSSDTEDTTAAAVEDTDASPTTTTVEAEADVESEPPAEPEEAESSAQWAQVTLSTGEVFDLVPTSCENQNTDPNDLLNDDFVDLFARNDDGFSFGVLNARSATSDPAPVQVELSGKRDENGVNPKISYIAAPGVMEATSITIDGTKITGESTIDARFSTEKPFGEEVVATFEFNC